MRNNQGRFGAPSVDNSSPAQQQTEQPLQFVTPTEFVELPSKGFFYPPGHPLHDVSTVEIRHMTAKDEDILTSVALLKKGIAIERFLENIIVDKSVRVNDLIIGDKNAIIIAARINGYGSEYEAGITCPSCASSVNFRFDLHECNEIPYDVYKEHDVTLTENRTFMIHLERSDLDVEVRLLNGTDELELSQLADNRRRKKLPESNLTDQLKRLIVAVGGKTDAGYINSFIQNMPAMDSRKLRGTYQKIIPNIDMRQNFVCSSCGHEGEVNVPFGANFFWPQQ